MKDDITFIAIAMFLLILHSCNINQNINRNVSSIDDKMDTLIEEVKKR